jgi:hypothetical protein
MAYFWFLRCVPDTYRGDPEQRVAAVFWVTGYCRCLNSCAEISEQ